MLSGFLGIGVLVAVTWKADLEPTHEGQPLTAWAELLDFSLMRPGAEQSRREAKAAIQQMGTNALPTLLGMLRVRDSTLKAKLRNLIPRIWHQRLRLTENGPRIRQVGCHSLSALGTNAATALPELIEIAEQHPDPDGRYRALFAMGYLGPAGERAIPFLVQCLTNSIPEVRDGAASSLGYIRRRPDIVIPALVQYLQMAKSPISRKECFSGIMALGQFGTNAKSAAPLLLSFANGRDSTLQSFATIALTMIDPDALGSSPDGLFEIP